MYNSNSQNLAEHGIHPRYLHLANIILLYNVLGINCLNMVVSVVIGYVQYNDRFFMKKILMYLYNFYIFLGY